MLTELYTSDEVAKCLRMSRRNLYRLINEGKIEHYKQPGLKGEYRFSEKQINDYLKRSTQ